MVKVVIIVLIAVLIVAIISSVVKKVKAARIKYRSLLGDAENVAYLIREAKDAADNFAAEKKSICGMTKLMLPLIKKDFPEFDWDEYRVLVDKQVKGYIEDRLKKENAVIHETEIADYRTKDGSCTITTQTSAGYTEEGKKIEKRYTTGISYVQDYQHLPAGQTGEGLTCPNCGAPVKILGRKYCEYCGLGITEVNRRVWKILETKEY